MTKRITLAVVVVALVGALGAAPADAKKKKVKKFNTEVSIEFSDDLSGGIEGIFGNLSAKKLPCGSSHPAPRTVTVYNAATGAVLGTDESDDLGYLVTLSSGVIPSGSYYATSEKLKFNVSNTKKIVCKAGTSETITVP